MSKSTSGIELIADKVRSGELKAVDLVKNSLDKAKSTKEHNVFISLAEERALKRALEIDEQIARGDKVGRLAGIPFVAKDNFLTFGSKTTAAAKYLQDFEAPYQATAINRLEEAGAICIGKSNLDAWAHGSSTENSDFFVTKNPHDKTRVPGGSSGGSAASVALSIATFALGSDTGGSIRQPASFCGVVGFKPTYGLVSRSGVVAMASSLDVVGPITNSAADAALVLDCIAGIDELDSTTIEKPAKDLSKLTIDIKKTKLGVIKEYMDEGLDKNVQQAVNQVINKLKSAGASVEEISLPSIRLALAAYYIICPAEVSSNLARYDGQRYGLSANASNLDDSYEQSREAGFGAEAKRRVMIGSHVLSSGYYDAYYKKALLVRTKLINEISDAFKKVDFLIGPTTPSVAFKIGEKVDDPLKMYLNDILTAAANITGNPAISIPAGTAGGLPVGFQIIGPVRGDQSVLALANETEELLR